MSDSEPTKIVSIEVKPTGEVEVFRQGEKGVIYSEHCTHKFWALTPALLGGKPKKLTGNLYYQYGYGFNTKKEFQEFTGKNRNRDIYTIWNPKENFMVRNNIKYFEGLKQKEVSVFSFDLETTSLAHDKTAKILLISTYYRDVNGIQKRLFSYDSYASEGEMLKDFSEYLRLLDPSILVGHNICCYDIPYMNFCAERAKMTLDWGRDGSALTIDTRESKFRKDGTQFIHYHKSNVYGREIVDTMFLSIKYDIGRKYENYRLKSIIAHEKMESSARTFYDAATIRHKYQDPIEFAKIKLYCEDDAEDAVKLWDLMSPSFFYLSMIIPKPFQLVMESATGSQINAMCVGHYLSQLYSIPKADEAVEFSGGLSLGNPGIYRNVFRADVGSLYPSVMLQYKIGPGRKDPLGFFIETLETLRTERLKNKQLAKQTGEKHYDDLQNSQKLVINSTYGFLGAPGLNFNNTKGAAEITRQGREVLTRAIMWSTGKTVEEIKREILIKTGKNPDDEIEIDEED